MINIDVLTRRQDDGRIQVISKHLNGEFLASFNTWPYSAVRITNEQFERYKPFLEKSEMTHEGILEYWSERGKDNGLPKLINKIF